MKILKCIICNGEIDILFDAHSVNKKVKCKKCGFTNLKEESKFPEVLIRKKILD